MHSVATVEGPVRPRMLVVEDSEEVAFALAEYFGERGYSVLCTSTFEGACAALKTFDFAAIIADCRLSGSGSQEGLDLLRFVDGRVPRPRFVLLTAYATRSMEAEARAFGANAVLLKPAPLDAVARAIEPARFDDTERTR